MCVCVCVCFEGLFASKRYIFNYSSSQLVLCRLESKKSDPVHYHSAYIYALVFSESGRLSLANGIDARHKEELNIQRVLH